MKEIPNSPLSPWTVHRYARVIKTFFKWCFDEELLPSNPAAKIRYPKLPKHGRIEIFSDEEVELLLKTARATSQRDYAIILLLLDTGIRRKELVDLVLNDVNVTTGKINIREGKGRKARQLRCGNTCRKALWHYLNGSRKPLHNGVASFFLGKSGGLLSYEAVGALCRHLSRKTGIRVYAHKFRHTFATMFARGTPNALLLADALGHEDLDMAKWYVHLAGTQSTDRTSPMDRLLSGNF